MKLRILTIATAGVLALSLAACQKKEETTVEAPAADAAAAPAADAAAAPPADAAAAPPADAAAAPAADTGAMSATTPPPAAEPEKK